MSKPVLSPPLLDVAWLISRAYIYKHIAAKRGVTEKTIKVQAAQIIRKLALDPNRDYKVQITHWVIQHPELFDEAKPWPS